VQSQEAKAKFAGVDSLEIEVSSFLLFVSGIFFGLEVLSRLQTLSQEIIFRNVIPQILVSAIGSAIIAIIYVWLGFLCWKDQTNSDNFIVASFVSGFLVFAYFVVQIIGTAFAQFYDATRLDYGGFVVGYGSVTIFIEMLGLFFTYRAYRMFPSLHSRIMSQESFKT